ncbi:Cleavage and polyadenylation specificity factor subunit 4 [Entomophthora muscae]|uniref:Cleavage and polyadenylation specificity factor subunit 4 n=1 Tax=Entomophthora muscae TaxID=34485 RepID=A0ACC2UAZ3_9FUNG|nr:Cleavage and polyadenylation specificity factor subunit 4 [Entomophthora muscae]
MIERKDLFYGIEFKTNKTPSPPRSRGNGRTRRQVGNEERYKPYQELYWAMNLFMGQEFTMVQMLDYLCHLEATHNVPNKEKPKYICPVNASTPATDSTKVHQTQERQIPLTDITCYCCQNKGHYATKCPNGQKVHMV